MLLFCIVKLSLSAPVPEVEIEAPPAKIPNIVVTEFIPPVMMQFLIALSVAPALDPRLII